ncbi:sigma-70 family RNA polymerase sigma factor [uncultured Weeksella sp.]|uniref:RNA polymerase sigma factor n=1 Tax=uncultured Weeksella sp. TaxID=1161389 RepID=UPI00259B5CAE|nr:sigma-70 family RNA polymerase sigma factor [uncultured Weeksella sp.]
MNLLKRHNNKEAKQVASLKTGCAKAQKEVFDLYSPKMLSICKAYISDFHYAEDCLLNGFCKVFNRIEQFQEKGSFEGWIRKIIVNECLSFIRSNQTFIFLDESFLPPISETIDDEEIFEFDVHQLLAQLDYPYRLVFNLYVLEDYSHQEITDQLNITVNTSKTQLHRAKVKLKEIVTHLNYIRHEKG